MDIINKRKYSVFSGGGLVFILLYFAFLSSASPPTSSCVYPFLKYFLSSTSVLDQPPLLLSGAHVFPVLHVACQLSLAAT